MIRSTAVLAGVLSATLAGVGIAPSAMASPSDDATKPSCTYTLSSPQLVQVSGTLMVTATLSPFPCTGSINPNSMTVCVSAEGGSSSGQCVSEARPAPAQVFLTPYRPGTVYVSKGVGCGIVYGIPGNICSTVGPKTATL